MAEVESAKYTNKHRNKAHSRSNGRYNQPTQFHPDRMPEKANDSSTTK